MPKRSRTQGNPPNATTTVNESSASFTTTTALALVPSASAAAAAGAAAPPSAKKPRLENHAALTVLQQQQQQPTTTESNRTSALAAPTMLLKGHAGAVFGLKFAPTGQQLLSAGQERSLFLWDVFGDQPKNTLVLSGHKGVVLDVAWGPVGSNTVFSASADHTGAVWDLECGIRTKQLRAHTACVNAVDAAHRGEPLVVTASDDGATIVHDIRRKRPAIAFTTERGSHVVPAVAVAFAPDGSTVFSGGVDNLLRVYDVRKGALRYALSGHADTITGVAVTKRGDMCASVAMDNAVNLWDVKPFATAAASTASVQDTNVSRMRHIATLVGVQNDFQQHILRCAWNGDGSRVAAGSADGIVSVWDATLRSLIFRLPGHAGCVPAVDMHPLEPIVASGGLDGKVFLSEITHSRTSHV